MTRSQFLASIAVLAVAPFGCSTSNESVAPAEADIQTADEFGASSSCITCVGYTRNRIALPAKDLTTYAAKKSICNAWTPKAGYAVIMPSSAYPQYGHIAYVSRVIDANTLVIDEANWGKACGVTTGVTIKISNRGVYGYYKP